MKAITAKNARGWGKTLSYALAALSLTVALGAAMPALAATRKGWKGSGNRYWTTDGNWANISATEDGYYLRSGEGTTLDATKRTILFNQLTSISIKISVENAGTSASVPYVFLADSDSYGLKTTGNFDVGTYKVGHLAIKRGTYQCNQLNVGGGDGTSGNVVVIGGNDNNATVTATGKVAINKETVQVKGKGKLICQYWAAAGNTDNNTGTLVIDGGEVQHNTANYLTIGDTAKATGYVYVKNGGKYSNTGSNAIGLCVGQKNVGTLDVDNGTVDLGTKKLMLCDNTSGKATITVKNGGVVTMGCVAYGTGTGGATMTIDGGTIKAAQSSAEFMPAIDKLNVYVGDSGATFDTAGHTVTIGENLQNASGKTGSARFTGSGVATLSAAPGYTGRTTVEIGTILHVPSPDGIGGGLAVSTPDVKPAVGTYTLLVCDGEDVFTNDMLTGVPVPAGATLSLSPDGKSVLCAWDGGAFWVGGTSGSLSEPSNWANNAVPGPGTNCIIGVSADATLTVGDAFAASSITFPGESAAVTINASGSESIAGIEAITNLSQTVSHTFNVPVAFEDKIFVVQGAMSWEQKSNPSIRFAGGVTGTTFASGTARYLNGLFTLTTGAGWVANTQGSNNRWGLPAGSWLTLPEATDTCELTLGDSSTAGGAFTTGVLRTSARLLCWNYGEYVVTNEFEAAFPGDEIHFCGHDGISNGKFKFEKLTLSGGSGTNPILKLGNGSSSTGDTGTQRFYIGKGGLCFADGAHQNLRLESGGAKNNATVRIDPWHGDYTIHKKANASSTRDFTVSTKTYFGTTDENGNACTVTDDGVINSHGDAAQIHIDGTGTFVVNAVGAATCAATVEGSATLAINAGKKLTTGTITVNSGAALEAASSGTYSLGDLTLKDGATLKFNFTDRRTAPVLNLEGKEVTFGDEKKITVSLNGTVRPAYGADGKWKLTDGFNFAEAGAVVAKAADCADWVKGFGFTDDGDLYADVKATGLMILFM